MARKYTFQEVTFQELGKTLILLDREPKADPICNLISPFEIGTAEDVDEIQELEKTLETMTRQLRRLLREMKKPRKPAHG